MQLTRSVTPTESMNLDERAAPGLLVQRVHALGDEREREAPMLLPSIPLREREVCRRQG